MELCSVFGGEVSKVILLGEMNVFEKATVR